MIKLQNPLHSENLLLLIFQAWTGMGNLKPFSDTVFKKNTEKQFRKVEGHGKKKFF